jgi:hypothetical protein
MMTRLAFLLLLAIGCAKTPVPNAPFEGVANSMPARGQAPLVALSCSSAAFNDVKIRPAVPLVYRTKLTPGNTPGEYSLVLSLEPAHTPSTLAGDQRANPELADDFLIRTEYRAQGRWDGETIKLMSDDFSMSLDRLAGEKTVFYEGSISLAHEHGVPMSCWSTPIAPEYHYDPSTGKCVDDLGEEGHNNWTLAFIRDTRNGECTDLGHAKINEEDYSYPNFEWNLRGADLSNIDMVFSNFVNSQFEGATLDGMNIGYTTVSGTMDAYTRLPSELCKTLSETSFTCTQ